MIFPDLPRRLNFSTATQPAAVAVPTPPVTETVPQVPQMSVEEWWIKHGLSTSSVSGPRDHAPINWLAQDAWEFYALCVFLIPWVAYWYQVSH